MTTQTYRKPTKAMRTHQLISRLEALGFTTEEAYQLRRIQMTLHRWAEAECNGDIQRDGPEADGKPFRVWNPYIEVEKQRKFFIPDREKGALKRLEKIVSARNGRQLVDDGTRDVQAYHQTDPRGCALYILRASDIEEGSDISSIYNRGVAVCD